MIDENLCSLLQCLLRVDGTVRRHFKYKLVVVGLLLDTIGLDSEFDVTDGGVDRIDSDNVDVGAELAVLIGCDIATTLVYRQIYLH